MGKGGGRGRRPAGVGIDGRHISDWPSHDYRNQYKAYMESSEYDFDLDPKRQWYNMTSSDVRWKIALRRALEWCPENPLEKLRMHVGTERACQEYMELLVDCPPERLQGYDLPPRSCLVDESALTVPLLIPTPKSICNLWRSLLEGCRDNNEHLDAMWKCVPFLSNVGKYCPNDK